MLFRLTVIPAIDHDNRVMSLDQVGISLQFCGIDID